MNDHFVAEELFVDPEIITQKNKQNMILVTGGSGLVGSTLIKVLLNRGEKVKAIYRREIPDIEGKKNVSWIKGDILDVISLDEAMQDVEQVYHCAAIVSFNSRKKNELFQTNIEGTANVVKASLAAGVKKFCFVSSVAAFGRSKKNVEISEKTAWSEESNSSNYGKSKYLAEIEV
ncbi:MAG: NAD-dependent epimerase/dehydratase family protein, partial [Segetibacter sp.]